MVLRPNFAAERGLSALWVRRYGVNSQCWMHESDWRSISHALCPRLWSYLLEVLHYLDIQSKWFYQQRPRTRCEKRGRVSPARALRSTQFSLRPASSESAVYDHSSLLPLR